MDIPTTQNLPSSVDQFPIPATLLATSGAEHYIMNVYQTRWVAFPSLTPFLPRLFLFLSFAHSTNAQGMKDT